MRYAKRKDNNHSAIRNALRDAGITVLDVHHLPGALDLWVACLGRVVMLEVKNGQADSLTEAEREIFRLFPLSAFRVETPEQAIELVRELTGIFETGE